MSNIKILRDLKPGQKGKVTKISGTGSIHSRILSMGIIKGTELKVERVAPFGDPVEIKLKSYHLSLRKSEAANIYLEVEE